MPEKMGNRLCASLPQEGVLWGGKLVPAENFLSANNMLFAVQGWFCGDFLFHFTSVEGFSRTASALHPVFQVNSP